MNLNPKTYSYVSKKSNNLILIAVGYIALLLTWFFGVSDKVFYFSYLINDPKISFIAAKSNFSIVLFRSLNGIT